MNPRLPILLGALMFAPCSTLAANLPATPANVETVIKGAKAGDVVLLAPGVYQPLEITFRATSAIKITSADPNRRANFKGLLVSNTTNLLVTDIEITAPHPRSGFRLVVGGESDGVRFERIDVHGTEPGDGSGVGLYDGRRIAIVDSAFHHMKGGIGHSGVTDLTLAGNRFSDLQLDGITGGNSTDVKILGNYFTDFYPIGGHLDAIQFYKRSGMVGRNLTIKGNLIDRGKGYPVQGIFMGNEDASVPYENLVIEDNFVLGAQYHGIMVDRVNNAKFTDNIVQGVEGQFQNSWAGISSSNNVVMERNLATGWRVWTNTGPKKDLGGWGDDIKPVKENDRKRLNAWLATRPAMAALVAGRPTRTSVSAAAPEPGPLTMAAADPPAAQPGASNVVTLDLGAGTAACRIDVARFNPATGTWVPSQASITSRCR